MLKSMTAYARVEKIGQDLSVEVEIRSYNSRGLDIAMRLPSGCAGFEEKIKGLISATLVRGRIDLRIRLKDLAEAAYTCSVDLKKAGAYLSALDQLRGLLKTQQEISLADLAMVPGIIQTVENSQSEERYWPLVSACVQQGLYELDRMRCQEGSNLAEDFKQRLDFISTTIDHIEKKSTDMVSQYRDKLIARIDALTRATIEIDQSRIAQEAAIMADRSDISEEIVRARSHLEQFRAIMQSEEAAGRKLNFLLQEFNREFNTMGSKIGQAEVAHLVVELKAELEKMREQVQNIE